MGHVILIVADAPCAGRVREELRHFPNLEISPVGDRAALFAVLAVREPDAIIADDALAGFAPGGALAAARRRCPDVPVVVLADDPTPEQALDRVLAGACDVVVKQRMGRLVPALERALGQRIENQRRRTEVVVRARRLEQLETIRDAALSLHVSGELPGPAAGLLSRAIARHRRGAPGWACEPSAAEDAPSRPRAQASHPDETVLVVEDDEDLRMLAALTLRRRGYRVLEAGGPDAALAVLAGSAGPVRLLVTDVHMPGGNGLSLAARCRAERPGLPVLVISADLETLARLDPGLDYSVLAKPFSPEELAQRVFALLAEASAVS